MFSKINEIVDFFNKYNLGTIRKERVLPSHLHLPPHTSPWCPAKKLLNIIQVYRYQIPIYLNNTHCKWRFCSKKFY